MNFVKIFENMEPLAMAALAFLAITIVVTSVLGFWLMSRLNKKA